MSCELVRAMQPLARPWAQELQSQELKWLQAHLQQCFTCGAWWQREAAWDNQLQRLVTAVSVPEGLLQRIWQRWQREKRRRWQRRALQLAVAALVLLALSVTLTWHVQPWARPLDLAALTGPVPFPEDPSPEAVTSLLERQGISLPAQLQRRWDFRHLKAIYYTYEQGRWLCNLEFRRDGSSAHVVVKLIPRAWCRPDQLETYRHYPGSAVLGLDEDCPYIAFVIGESGHITSFYRQSDPAG